MTKREIKSDLLLLLTAAIWGFAFVAQRAGMEHIGPFIFNALRFGLGGFTLIPVIIFLGRNRQKINTPEVNKGTGILLWGGLLAGICLFLGASLQQSGIVYTTAGKAGFITGLYVIIVPILGLFWRQRVSIGTGVGAVLAVVGLYLLSITGRFTFARGDDLVLAGSFFWAIHVIVIGKYSPKVNPVKLAFVQFLVCSLLSFVVSFMTESTSLDGIYGALIPVLYGGFMSAGIAFTLQVVAQRDAPPAHAAIIMSLEAVFAVIGGILILAEVLSLRGFFGCVLMLSGMILSKGAMFIKQSRMKGFPGISSL